MNSSHLHAKVLPSLLGGTARHPLSSDKEIEMLSLMGQALRFERPLTPQSWIVEPEIKDDRTIISNHLRRPLVRVLTAKNTTDHPARALARAFDRFRLRPHPFDLPLIETFVRSHAEKLGATAQHWADRQKPDAGTQSYFDPEQLDDCNWTQAALSRRVAYLERKRRVDAEAARALAESSWAQEDSEARFRLLQVFETQLSVADQTFLTSLEKDRAPRVRAFAQKLLARLDACRDNPTLKACLDRIKQGKSGLVRKRMTLQVELPADVKQEIAPRWIRQTFIDVSFSELAGAYKISENDLIEAASKDELLLLALALIATSERGLDLLGLIVAHLPDAWERLFQAGLDTLGTITNKERQRWAEILVDPYRKDPPASYPLWEWLHRMMDWEAPSSILSMILETDLLNKIHELEPGHAIWTELIAAMCPPSERRQLRQQLTAFDPAHTVTALTLLEILDGMENDRNHV